MTFLGDERTDATAVDAMEAAATPPRQPARPYLVLLLDESGPLDSFWESIPLDVDAVVGVARAFWLKRDFSTVLKAEWATKHLVGMGREFHITIPGTHEVKVAPKRKATRAPEPRYEYAHASAADVSDRFDWRNDSGLKGIVARDRRSEAVALPAPAVEPGPHCGCGIKHTLASFRALPLVSARDRTEGFTAIHDEAHVCACGETLRFTTTRLLGGK